MKCIFCEIVASKIKASIIYQDELVIAFDDIYPQAPIHKLIIPREHFDTLNEIDVKDKSLVGHMFYVAGKLAHKLNIADEGYRALINCNEYGGQTVFHLHLHLMGGRVMTWPPG